MHAGKIGGKEAKCDALDHEFDGKVTTTLGNKKRFLMHFERSLRILVYKFY
jgi:hypothetical protein